MQVMSRDETICQVMYRVCGSNPEKCVCCARDVIDFIARGDEGTATGLTVGMMPFVSGDTSHRCE